ncbi:hypothetical protein ANN_15426 [Periplaneta americana]|uniref:Reverse transcriptase domain-containing protein n=1 Tax=Periplaneta americana TaxID=6978 RepID=A0ABQ8SGC6_PERAM|nr:hypothetical protein ANN_15426 [Periplaneta americana]
MGESRNAYRVLVGRLEGKRPLGMPRRRWEDNIKMDLREVGYDCRDWINLAHDRDQWRAYVRAAMNLRVPQKPVVNYPKIGLNFIIDTNKASLMRQSLKVPTPEPEGSDSRGVGFRLQSHKVPTLEPDNSSTIPNMHYIANHYSLMLAGSEFQSLGRDIVKEDEYEEVRWDGIVKYCFMARACVQIVVGRKVSEARRQVRRNRRVQDFEEKEKTINLISQSAKIFLRILNRRLYSEMEEQLEEEQFRFGKGKGMDAIGLLRTIDERYLEKNKEMYLLFVDLEKAFDRVD